MIVSNRPTANGIEITAVAAEPVRRDRGALRRRSSARHRERGSPRPHRRSLQPRSGEPRRWEPPAASRAQPAPLIPAAASAAWPAAPVRDRHRHRRRRRAHAPADGRDAGDARPDRRPVRAAGLERRRAPAAAARAVHARPARVRVQRRACAADHPAPARRLLGGAGARVAGRRASRATCAAPTPTTTSSPAAGSMRWSGRRASARRPPRPSSPRAARSATARGRWR